MTRPFPKADAIDEETAAKHRSMKPAEKIALMDNIESASPGACRSKTKDGTSRLDRRTRLG
jgi:hypothetical protein